MAQYRAQQEVVAVLEASRLEAVVELPIDLHKAAVEGQGMTQLASKASLLILKAQRASNSQVLMRAPKIRI